MQPIGTNVRGGNVFSGYLGGCRRYLSLFTFHAGLSFLTNHFPPLTLPFWILCLPPV